MSSMFTLRAVATLLLVQLGALAPPAAAQIHKCITNGSVTYQRDPCPTAGPRQQPDPKRLNAQRRERLRQAEDGAASAPAGVQQTSSGTSGVPPARDTAPAFRCDGRTFCSQMTSCAEAKYFLAHCPGVKMDGNRDGVPCERQWCNR